MGQPKRLARLGPVEPGKITIWIIHGQPGIDLSQPGVDFFCHSSMDCGLEEISLTV